jgi:hypothetical protein
MTHIPLDDSLAYAIAKLVDDAQKDKREPTHSEIDFEIKKAGLLEFDPNKPSVSPVGKMKRVRNVIVSSLDSQPVKAESFAYGIINLIKAHGGFREGSPNYVGENEIENLTGLLKSKGILLTKDGSISSITLDNLSTKEMTEALQNYVDRAKRGFEDAALIVGTGKDLLEAVSAHVLQEKYGNYSTTANFPTLLGQAFVSLGMATPENKKEEGEHPRKAIERNLYDLACAINRLRNKEGTGHGRPFIPDLSNEEAIEAIRIIGIISDKMINKLT